MGATNLDISHKTEAQAAAKAAVAEPLEVFRKFFIGDQQFVITSYSIHYTKLYDASNVDSVVESIKDISNGGAHVSIDALGSIATCSNSIDGLRKRGKHIQVGLMVGDDRRPALPMDLV